RGKQDQRAVDAFVWCFLQIGPAQERHDQAKLRKAVFAHVTLSIQAHTVERSGEETVVFELQPAAKIDGALQIGAGPLVQMKELDGIDRFVVDDIWRRTDCQIDRRV